MCVTEIQTKLKINLNSKRVHFSACILNSWQLEVLLSQTKGFTQYDRVINPIRFAKGSFQFH